MFPPEVRAVLAAFELFSLNFFELGLPLECMGLVSFFNRLLFTLLAPLGLLACAPPLAWCMLRLGGGERSPRAVLLAALPVALKLLYVVFPLISSVAVQAFDCEAFDTGELWLRSDYSLQCGWGDERGLTRLTPEYESVRAVAVVNFCLFSGGVPLLFLGLLLQCRRQLSRRAPSTPLSHALGFLCAEYKKRFFWYEVVESTKKLFFVSLVRLVAMGSLVQIFVALAMALGLLVLQLTAAPYRRRTDNFLALLSAVSYCLLLQASLALKIDVLFDALSEQLSDQMKRTSSIPSVPLVLVLLACTLSSVTAAAALLLREVLRDLQQPKLRYAGTRVLVSIPPQPGRTHEVFISHLYAAALLATPRPAGLTHTGPARPQVGYGPRSSTSVATKASSGCPWAACVARCALPCPCVLPKTLRH